VPLHRYVISTFLGIIPGTLVFTSVGAGLGEVFAAGETPNLGIIFEPHILLPILGLSALSLLPILVKAVKMGASVVLLEGHKMGGDCLNFGCVPSKALIASGKAAYGQAHASAYGVANVVPQVDYAAAKDHVAGVIAQIEPVDSQERFESLGVRVIREYGKFISASEVEAGAYRIKVFELREQPEHLLIIGGGPIGMEMAQAHLRMGSKVTVIEGAKALGKDDPEMAAIVLDKLRAEGLVIEEDALAGEIKGKALRGRRD